MRPTPGAIERYPPAPSAPTITDILGWGSARPHRLPTTGRSVGPDDAADAPRRAFAGGDPLHAHRARASSASRARTSPGSSSSKATSSTRSRSAIGSPTSACARRNGSRSLASSGPAGSGVRPYPREEARLHGRRHTQGTRRGRHLVPLRRLQRLLPHDPRALDDVLVRGVVVARHHARRRAGREVRPHLPQARAAARACACSTSGCGWGGMVMHAARHYGVEAVGVTLSHDAGRVRARSAVRDAGLQRRRHPRAGLPRRRRAVRRDQLDRHVRARRARAARRVLHPPATNCSSRAPAC